MPFWDFTTTIQGLDDSIAYRQSYDAIIQVEFFNTKVSALP